MDTDETAVLMRVSNRSDPHSVAAKVAHLAYKGQDALLRAVGANAVNQAVKAAAIALRFASEHDVELVVRPGFATVSMRAGERDVERSALTLRVSRAVPFGSYPIRPDQVIEA